MSRAAARERGVLACGAVAIGVGLAAGALAHWSDAGWLEIPERRLLLRGLAWTGCAAGAALLLLRRQVAALLVPLLAAGLTVGIAAGLVQAADLFMSYRALTHKRPGEEDQGLHRVDERLGWLPRANAVSRHRLEGSFDVEYRTDAEGFREVPYRGDPQRRLWLFGDSFTFGYGVDGEDAYPNRMARDYLSPRIRVINAAVSGHGLVQMYARLVELRERLDPGDLVVFALISEDLHRNLDDFVFLSQLLYGEFRGRELRFPAFRDGRLESVRVDGAWNRLRALLFHAPLTEGVHRFVHRAVTGSAHRSIAEAHALLERTRELCAERRSGFALVFLPRAVELVRGGYKVDVSSFDYVDIRRFFPEDEDELSGLRFPNDAHWTPRGHEIGAGALVAALLERGLLAPADLRDGVVLPRPVGPAAARPARGGAAPA